MMRMITADGMWWSKRGSIVDWSISMAIFIIAVTSVLMVLRPANVSQVAGPPLVESIADRVMEMIGLEVRETPVFVQRIESVDPASHAPVELRIELAGQGFAFTTANETTASLPALSVHTTGRTVHISCPSLCDDRVVLLRAWRIKNENALLVQQCSTTDRSVCNATLGSTVNVQGINARKLSSLGDYQLLKQQLDIPSGYEFGIYLLEPQTQTIIQGPTKQQGPVYATTRAAWIVDGYGGRSPAVLQVRVW